MGLLVILVWTALVGSIGLLGPSLGEKKAWRWLLGFAMQLCALVGARTPHGMHEHLGGACVMDAFDAARLVCHSF